MSLRVVLRDKKGNSHSRANDAPIAWAGSYTGPRQENQDYYGRADQETPHYDWQGRGCLYVLADGMGGLAAGAQAARMAVKEVIEQYSRGPQNSQTAQHLAEAIQKANRKIYAAGQGKGGRMGSTIVACVLKDGNATVAHAGDSRAYVLSNGVLNRLTADHLFAKEVLGIKDDDDAKKNPEGHKITRALGKDPDIQIETGEGSYGLEDRFLLCSDGFSEVLSEDEIKECLSEPTPEKAVHALISSAGSRLTDNATAVVAFASGNRIRRRQTMKKVSFAVTMLILATALGAGGWWGWNHGGEQIWRDLTGPKMDISDPSLAFGDQEVGTNRSVKHEDISNAGRGILTVSPQLTGPNSGDFLIKGCEEPVSARAKCTIDITFAPTTPGSKSATLKILDKEGRLTKKEVSLSGVATAKPAPQVETTLRPPDLVPPQTRRLPVKNGTRHIVSLANQSETLSAGATADLTVAGSSLPKQVSWHYFDDPAQVTHFADVSRKGKAEITDPNDKFWSQVKRPSSTVSTQVPIANDTRNQVAVSVDDSTPRTIDPMWTEHFSVAPGDKSTHTATWHYSQDASNSLHKITLSDGLQTTSIKDVGDVLWNQTTRPIAIFNNTNHPVGYRLENSSSVSILQQRDKTSVNVSRSTRSIQWWYEMDPLRHPNAVPIKEGAGVITDDDDQIWKTVNTEMPPKDTSASGSVPPSNAVPASQQPPPSNKNASAATAKGVETLTIANHTSHDILVRARLADQCVTPQIDLAVGETATKALSEWHSPPTEICWTEKGNIPKRIFSPPIWDPTDKGGPNCTRIVNGKAAVADRDKCAH